MVTRIRRNISGAFISETGSTKDGQDEDLASGGDQVLEVTAGAVVAPYQAGPRQSC